MSFSASKSRILTVDLPLTLYAREKNFTIESASFFFSFYGREDRGVNQKLIFQRIKNIERINLNEVTYSKTEQG